MNPVFTGTVEKGKLRVNLKEQFQGYLDKLSGAVEVIVKPYKANRSDNQNRYYWGVVVPMIADETGYTKDEMHEILRGLFLGDTVNVYGKEVKISRSTASLKTSEFEEYLEKCRGWASETLSCYVPVPNEVDF